VGALSEKKIILGDHEKLSPIKKPFGDAMLEVGTKNEEVILLCNDLREAIACEQFIGAYPERYIECGIAEANMMGMAAGAASCGMVPFVVSYATFATWRVAEQLRNDVSYTGFNVKIGSMTTGVTFGQGGMSHQSFEDITLTRCLPNFTVLVPADPSGHREVALTAAEHVGPVFMRLGRDNEYHVYADGGYPMEVGGSNLLREGVDIAFIACGFMVREALLAADELEKQGVSAAVLDLYSIKPIDSATLFDLAEKVKAFMTIEEHFIEGGMGSAVIEAFNGRQAPPVLRKGISGFPPIGPKFEVRELIGLDAKTIAKDAIDFIGKL
jgi:transketolase